ncbi:MAG: hypothetical protein WAW86_04460 [Gammaproteobacteria bacterium]
MHANQINANYFLFQGENEKINNTYFLKDMKNSTIEKTFTQEEVIGFFTSS